MDNQVNLLVCLGPSRAQSKINQAILYLIMRPVVRILNIKIITLENQIKAFNQVENQTSADLAISKLNNKLLNMGKVRVFVSNKTNITYAQSLEQILAESGNSLTQKNEKPSLSNRNFSLNQNYNESSLRGYKNQFRLKRKISPIMISQKVKSSG